MGAVGPWNWSSVRSASPPKGGSPCRGRRPRRESAGGSPGSFGIRAGCASASSRGRSRSSPVPGRHGRSRLARRCWSIDRAGSSDSHRAVPRTGRSGRRTSSRPPPARADSTSSARAANHWCRRRRAPSRRSPRRSCPAPPSRRARASRRRPPRRPPRLPRSLRRPTSEAARPDRPRMRRPSPSTRRRLMRSRPPRRRSHCPWATSRGRRPRASAAGYSPTPSRTRGTLPSPATSTWSRPRRGTCSTGSSSGRPTSSHRSASIIRSAWGPRRPIRS